MTPIDYDALFASLNEAVEILNDHRSPDPDFVAALDALKQARARVARLQEHATVAVREPAAGLAA